MTALLAGVIDTSRPPLQESFDDDLLRMLRAVRFVSQLVSGSHRVIDAIAEMNGQIERITAERVRVELDKRSAASIRSRVWRSWSTPVWLNRSFRRSPHGS